MNYDNLQEEELKARIGDAFFADFDCDTIIGKIDFCAVQKQKANAKHVLTGGETVSLLWAEAKRGTVADIYKPLVQLILTIGKARTFDTYLPPPFLAAFDAEKIAFLPYREILPFLALNDFNWNVTPSDTSSREFGLLYDAVKATLDKTSYLFRYDAHEKELREFIKQHLKVPSKPLPVIKNHRERKGSFFTPKIWVDLSQKYLADVLGDNWQDEYYVWDCAAGTGNLLNGLTNKYNIWASTLDQQDVDVMKDRIKNGANLLESHVFQFDFLNDEFDCGKLPDDLLSVLKDPAKRKKLVVYINPPYVEADSRGGEGRSGVAISLIQQRYETMMGYAKREVYIQFVARIYNEIPNVMLALFSSLKIELAPRFSHFRHSFKALLKKTFLIPAFTFDNVVGKFPISFAVWDTASKEQFLTTTADVFNELGDRISTKKIFTYDNIPLINDWTLSFISEEKNTIGTLVSVGNDFQHQNFVRLENPDIPWNHQYLWRIHTKNLIQTTIYFSVRIVIAATWLNDRDQFLAPNNGWKTDREFQANCLTYALFCNKNTIKNQTTNHWIPFTEEEVNAQLRFESHFMTDFMAGKLVSKTSSNGNNLLEEESFVPSEPLIFSPEATAVFDAGRELWRYYHAQPGANPNASYYDIRAHFQGRNEKGKMNPKSEDKEYMRLLANLKEAMETLRLKIVPKVYEYGFLIS